MINRRDTGEKKSKHEIDIFIDRLAELLLSQIEENNEISKTGGRASENKKSPSYKSSGRKKTILSVNLPVGINLAD